LNLQTFGNISSAYKHQPNDNSGLWTENYMASQSFRYASSNNTHAYTQALQALSTIETLVNVTGKVGLPARTMTDNHSYIQHLNDHWGWNLSPTISNWWFIANTSSDEMTGHIYGLSTFVTHGAPYDIKAKKRGLYLIETMLTRIIHGGLVVRDITGLPSKWGNWNPRDLNTEESWADERGLNSLQILSYLAVGLRHVVNPSAHVLYASTATDLLNATNRFDLNILNQKITSPTEINYSDNSLAFKPYYMLAESCGYGMFPSTPSGMDALSSFCTRLAPWFQLSLERAFKVIEGEKASLYNLIFLLSADTTVKSKFPNALSESIETLKEYPLDLVDYPHDNSHRLDLEIDRSLTPMIVRSSTVLPRHNSAALRWCDDPFAFVGGSGMREEDPTFWLEAYWMGKFYRLI